MATEEGAEGGVDVQHTDVPELETIHDVGSVHCDLPAQHEPRIRYVLRDRCHLQLWWLRFPRQPRVNIVYCSFPAAKQPPPGHLAAGAAQHPRRRRGWHRRERLRELRRRRGHGDCGLKLRRPGVAEQLHEAHAGVGARGGDVGVSVRVGVEVWVWHGEGDDGTGHGVGVLRVVQVGSAVERRRHRRVGVGTGRRRRACGASGGAREDGGGGGGGHRWPEELTELEWWIGVRVRVSGGRRHGRRLVREGGRWQWSRSELGEGREDEVEMRGRASRGGGGGA